MKIEKDMQIPFNTAVDYRSWFDLVDSTSRDLEFVENIREDENYQDRVSTLSDKELLEIVAQVTEFETYKFEAEFDMPELGLKISATSHKPSESERLYGGLGIQEVIRYGVITHIDQEVWDKAKKEALAQIKGLEYGEKTYLSRCIMEDQKDEVKLLEYILLNNPDILEKLKSDTLYGMSENYSYFINYEQVEEKLTEMGL